MEAQPVTPGAALFSEEQLAALQRLRTAFEQKLLDEDEYKTEKAKVLNATPAAPPPPPADDDDDGFELVGVDAGERAPSRGARAGPRATCWSTTTTTSLQPAPASRREPPPTRRSADRRGAQPPPRLGRFLAGPVDLRTHVVTRHVPLRRERLYLYKRSETCAGRPLRPWCYQSKKGWRST